jgi:hypothetical protein
VRSVRQIRYPDTVWLSRCGGDGAAAGVARGRRGVSGGRSPRWADGGPGGAAAHARRGARLLLRSPAGGAGRGRVGSTAPPSAGTRRAPHDAGGHAGPALPDPRVAGHDLGPLTRASRSAPAPRGSSWPAHRRTCCPPRRFLAGASGAHRGAPAAPPTTAEGAARVRQPQRRLGRRRGEAGRHLRARAAALNPRSSTRC